MNKAQPPWKSLRVGQGFDSHPYAENRKLILGGIEIPYDQGLLGHSDADCVIHAIMDACLGATAYGSIGELFPSDDANYKDTDSRHLLLLVAKLLEKNQWQIINIDVTIIAQQPRLQPFVSSMRVSLSAIIGLQADQLSIKVKSPEHLGALGRVEGIASFATCLLVKEETTG